MTTAIKSKLAGLLKAMFNAPEPQWRPLPNGLELRVQGLAGTGTREILARRPGSRPGEKELEVLARDAQFEDWEIFWLRNPAGVAWIVEVTPDGSWNPKDFLEFKGKRDAVIGYERSVTYPRSESSSLFFDSTDEEPAPRVTKGAVASMLPAFQDVERQRIITALMDLTGDLNDTQRDLRRDALNSMGLAALKLEASRYCKGTVARALDLTKLPNFEELGR